MALTLILLPILPRFLNLELLWAIRDVVLAVLVGLANKQQVNLLLLGCVAIDFTDIISAYLSGVAGGFGTADGWLLKLTSTAIAALCLDLIALLLIAMGARSPIKSTGNN